MKFINKRLLFATIFVLVVFMPIFSFAQDCTQTPPPLCCTQNPPSCPANNPTATTTITNPISQTSINGFILVILQGVIKIGIPIVALAIIYSGFLFVAAQGKPEKLKEAKNALVYSLIGAAILIGSWAIAQLISNTILGL
jgi:hypothetical protein